MTKKTSINEGRIMRNILVTLCLLAVKIEFEAMRQRYNRLLVYASGKDCDMSGIRTERIPSLDEAKKSAKTLREPAGTSMFALWK